MKNSTYLPLSTSLTDVDFVFTNFDDYVRDIGNELFDNISNNTEKHFTYQSDIYGNTDVQIYYNALMEDGWISISVYVEYENNEGDFDFRKDIVLEQRVIEALSELIDVIKSGAEKVKIISCNDFAEVYYNRLGQRLFIAVDKTNEENSKYEFIPLKIEKPSAEVISSSLAENWEV